VQAPALLWGWGREEYHFPTDLLRTSLKKKNLSVYHEGAAICELRLS
jgi:hypothetical protein